MAIHRGGFRAGPVFRGGGYRYGVRHGYYRPHFYRRHHFHRRFYAVFRRPMAHGEYSQLLLQIRRGRAEHLGENCWRVTLPGGSRTLPVRATSWRLITILPKNWQPPTSVAPSPSDSSSSELSPAQEPSL